MKIAVIGADGQLGTDLVLSLSGQDVFPLFYPDFDILCPDAVESKLCDLEPDIVINTAAYNQVDKGEDAPSDAFRLNTLAVKHLASTCSRAGTVLVHFSTDYVFDGLTNIPYTEDDCPRPLNVYGISKLAGEYFVQSYMARFFLIRTSSLFGTAGCWGKGKKNFVDSILSMEEAGQPLRVVSDQRVTPTSTRDLADRVAELIQTERFGLYHMTNEGSCTWYEYARIIFELKGTEPDLTAIDSETLGAPARRPSYSVLENRRARKAGISDFPEWRDSLRDYMAEKGYID